MPLLNNDSHYLTIGTTQEIDRVQFLTTLLLSIMIFASDVALCVNTCWYILLNEIHFMIFTNFNLPLWKIQIAWIDFVKPM